MDNTFESQSLGQGEYDALQTQQNEPAMTWRPSSALPTPRPMPGWALRWVRVTMRGDSDGMNFQAALREHYRPVHPSEQPEIQQLLSYIPGANKDHIEFGGLMLCKRPLEIQRQADTHYTTQTARQVETVDARLKQEFAGDTRVRLVNERQTHMSGFGSGKL